MARRSINAPDEARSLLIASFTAAGQSGSAAFFPGGVNAVVTGTFVGTVRPERSFDGGATWTTIKKDLAAADLAFTASDAVVIDEPESAVLYRWNCTAWTSGTISARLSQG